jgi:hypothetical protein
VGFGGGPRGLLKGALSTKEEAEGLAPPAAAAAAAAAAAGAGAAGAGAAAPLTGAVAAAAAAGAARAGAAAPLTPVAAAPAPAALIAPPPAWPPRVWVCVLTCLVVDPRG